MYDRTVAYFEDQLADYTGAPYAIAMKRCCIALKGCCEYLRDSGFKNEYLRTTEYPHIHIPSRTYEFVPQTLVRSNFLVKCFDVNWSGGYELWPYPVWDYARRFRPNMYVKGQYQCLSFHRSKILGHTEGGAVLTDNQDARDWLIQWRDDGRRRSGWRLMIGESGLMFPDIADSLEKKLHWRRTFYDIHFGPHPDLPHSNYPDLSLIDWNQTWREQQKIS